MPKCEVRQTGKLNLTSAAGLARIGQCCEAAQVDRVIDPRLPVSQGMFTLRTWRRPPRSMKGVISSPSSPALLHKGEGGFEVGLRRHAR
jgi:hypothetical protein